MLYPLSYGGSGGRNLTWHRPRGVKPVRGSGTPRRYPLPVTPEQLSTAIVDALTTLADEGALTLPDGVPTR